MHAVPPPIARATELVPLTPNRRHWICVQLPHVQLAKTRRIYRSCQPKFYCKYSVKNQNDEVPKPWRAAMERIPPSHHPANDNLSTYLPNNVNIKLPPKTVTRLHSSPPAEPTRAS